MPIPAALIGGGATVLGGLFGRSGQSSANAANLAIARENREWQERMSNTAYQRATKDLEKAGLNRILALGSPSSTPAGNIATMQNVNKPIEDSLRNASTTALKAATVKQQIKNMKAVERKDFSQGTLNSIAYNVQQKMQEKLQQEIGLLQKQQPGAQAEAELWQKLNTQGGTAKGLQQFLPLLIRLFGNR